MAVEEVNQELWKLAVANVTKQQEEAFDALLKESVDAHLANDECEQCEECDDGISDRCEDWLRERIEDWQEGQFDDEAEAEYDRLEELRAEQEEQGAE
jgi:hypothetical protein